MCLGWATRAVIKNNIVAVRGVCTISLCCTFLLSSCFNYNYFLTFSRTHERAFWSTGTVAAPLGPISGVLYNREGKFFMLLGHH